MKNFELQPRQQSGNRSIPQLRVGVAHITGPGKITKISEDLMFEMGEAKQIRLDVGGMKEIVNYGDVEITSFAMQLIRDREIGVSWLSANGCKLNGRLAPDNADRTLTRLLQYQAWEDREWQLNTAIEIVARKIDATQSALRHYQRQGKPLRSGTLHHLDDKLRYTRSANSVDQLRGIEGNVAATWFQHYAGYFGQEWKFEKRNRRPPTDPVNSLLSLFYMQVYRRIACRIEGRGYEPMLGALHEFRPGRYSMACDIMEPLRIPAVDRWIVAVCRQGVVSPSDFEKQADGAVWINKRHLGKMLTRFEEHWHQNHYDQIIELALNHWAEGLRNQVVKGSSRAAAYLRDRIASEEADSSEEGQAS